MKVAIDGAGWLVIPKALREALGIQAGDVLELEVHEGRLEMQPAPNDMRLINVDGHPVIRSSRELPTLRAEEVRSIMEQVRR